MVGPSIQSPVADWTRNSRLCLRIPTFGYRRPPRRVPFECPPALGAPPEVPLAGLPEDRPDEPPKPGDRLDGGPDELGRLPKVKEPWGELYLDDPSALCGVVLCRLPDESSFLL